MQQSAASQYQAAGMQSLLGNEKLAETLTNSAQAAQKTASTNVIGQIPYSNVAQSGGGDIGTVIDIAMAGKGLIGVVAKGGAKLAAKNLDEVVAPLARQLDRFDEIAKNAKIDLQHILDGHLNGKGKAVGFHSRPDGIDPPNAKMTEQIGLKNPQGVYKGKVEIRDPATGNWVPKKKNSTFFPDHMTPKEIEAAVRHAYADALRKGGVTPDGEFTGRSGFGFEITGVVRNNQIPTAYPVM
jgi:Bacterial EndoU nuclease